MPNTTGGLPYPDPSAPVAQGANDIRLLAEALNPVMRTPWTTPVSGVTAGTGWSITTTATARLGYLRFYYVRATATAAHAVSATSGILTDGTVCTWPAGILPTMNYPWPMGGANSRVAAGHLLNSGAMIIGTVTGSNPIAINDAVTLAGYAVIEGITATDLPALDLDLDLGKP